jgi:two-component system response regulator DevR
MLRVVIVDDHEVVRMGLRLALEDVDTVSIVGEAASATEALTICKALRPDIVIMDIRMPDGSGIDACREIVSALPETRVIMLTSFADDDLIADAIQAGAVGYVLKRGGTAELLQALEAVRQGAALLDPAVTRRVLAMMRQKDKAVHVFRDLTGRELEVLSLISQGKTNAEIAEAFVLSEKTIRNHVSSILDKLVLTNRVEAATFAVRHHLKEYLNERGREGTGG